MSAENTEFIRHKRKDGSINMVNISAVSKIKLMYKDKDKDPACNFQIVFFGYPLPNADMYRSEPASYVRESLLPIIDIWEEDTDQDTVLLFEHLTSSRCRATFNLHQKDEFN